MNSFPVQFMQVVFNDSSWLLFYVRQAAADLAYKVLSNTTMSFSNIVGPTDEVSFCGHPMVYLAPSVYGHPHVSIS